MSLLPYSRLGTGAPVVFVHNAGNDRRNWDGVIERLRDAFACEAIDLPGYGESADKGTQTLELHAAAVHAHLVERDLRDVHLVGHCVGAAACWAVAMRDPTRVASLTLFSPATEATMSAGLWGPMYRLSAAWPTGFRMARSAVAASTSVPAVRRYSVRSMFGSGAPTDDFRLHSEALLLRPGAIERLGDLLRNFDSFRSLDHFRRLRGFPRTMLLWGDANRVLPISAMDAVQARLQPERTEVLTGKGHLAMVEDPALCALLLIDWLTSASEKAA